jgi:hypothetical protein
MTKNNAKTVVKTAKFRQDSPIFPESTGLYHSKLFIELDGGMLR